MIWKWLATAAIVAIVCLAWPFSRPTRELYPPETINYFGLNGHRPLPVVTAQRPAAIKLVISPDYGDIRGPLSPQGIAALDGQAYLASRQAEIERAPYRFPKRLGIAIGTHARSNSCTLTLVVGTLRSQPLACATLENNALAPFAFDAPIPPGVQLARLESSSTSETDGVSPYAFVGNDGADWALPIEMPPSTNAFTALSYWARQAPSDVAFYLVAVGILIALALQRRLSPVRLALTMLTVQTLALFIIARPLSGFDETAHLDMLFRASPEAESPTELQAFFDRTAPYVAENDFFRLNPRTYPTAKPDCPHMILLSCGLSERPSNFYAGVMGVASRFHTGWTPDTLNAAGRLANVALIGAVMLIVYLMFGTTWVASAAVLLLLAAAPLFQMPSVTNDVFTYAVAMLTAITAGVAVERRLVGWRTSAVVMCLALVFLARFVDRNWLLFLPLVGGIVAWVALGLMPTASTAASRRPFSSLLAAAAFLATIAAAFAAQRWLQPIAELEPQRLSHLKFLQDDAIMALLRDGTTLGMRGKAEIVALHLESNLGTHIWGHAKYSGPVYALLGAAWLALSAWGFARLAAAPIPAWRRVAMAIVAGAAVGAQLVVAYLIAKPHYGTHPFVLEANAQLRLTAPGFAVLNLFCLVGLNQLLQHPKWRRPAFQVVALWLLILNLHFLPRFHWGQI